VIGSVDLLFQILNGWITVFCGMIIFYFIYKERLESHYFYYSWSIGFIIYGIQIIIRPLISELILAAMMLPALFFFLSGIWSLSRKREFLYLMTGVILCLGLLFPLYLFGVIQPSISVRVFGFFILFMPIVVAMVYNRVIFGKTVDKFGFGWLMLFLANILLSSGWILDVFASLSKILIFFGILDYDFVIITERVRQSFLSQSISTERTREAEEEGKYKLILNVDSLKEKEAWLYRKIQENVMKNVPTYLFSFQDLLSDASLQRIKEIDPGKVFIFVFSSSEKKSNNFKIAKMGITQIGATISQVIAMQSNHDKATIILSDLSLLIHFFGTKPVYRMILNKMGALRDTKIEFIAFFHPETHSDKSVVHLFKTISDEVIKK
jgi:hypothetical protein